MTLEEIKAFQQQHGYGDMPTGQFVQAINKKYGSFTNFMGSVLQGSIPEPIRSVGQGVANIFNNATRGTVYDPQNITEGYKQLYNSDSPMYDYEQGAMGLLGQMGQNLAAQNRAMIGNSGIDPRTGRFTIDSSPDILREQMNMAIGMNPMMGMIKNPLQQSMFSDFLQGLSPIERSDYLSKLRRIVKENQMISKPPTTGLIDEDLYLAQRFFKNPYLSRSVNEGGSLPIQKPAGFSDAFTEPKPYSTGGIEDPLMKKYYENMPE